MADTLECGLCRLPVASPIQDGGKAYCCPSCLEVARLLREQGPAGSSPSSLDAANCTGGAPEASVSRGLSTVEFALGGLWCTSCAWLVEARLRRLPGVNRAAVHLARGRARITFDPARTDPDRFLAEVRRAGYLAWRPGDRAPDAEGDLVQRLLVCGVLVGHDLILSAMVYGRELMGWATPDTEWIVRIFQWMMVLGSAPVIALLGPAVLRVGWAALRRGLPNTHTLIALGVIAAVAESLVLLGSGATRTYADTASMLLFLLTLGHYLEVRAQREGGEALSRLETGHAAKAIWIAPDGDREVAADSVPIGARVRVAPGQPFPVDGLVVVGEGRVTESALSGEPLPVHHQVGDRVLAGTCNLDREFEVVAMRVGDATSAGRASALLREALWQRAPIERSVDRIAAVLVPAAALVAGGTGAYWWLAADASVAMHHALSVLLIACPCALGLATPLTLTTALARAAQVGAALRGPAVLERLADVRVAYLDKTGTLTWPTSVVGAMARDSATGEPDGADGRRRALDTLLARTAAIEAATDHPLAGAFARAAEARNVAVPAAADARTVPGRGVVGEVDGATVLVGSEEWLATSGLPCTQSLSVTAARWRARGYQVAGVGWDGRFQGVFALGEAVREEAPAAIAALHELGVPATVLTGDAIEAAPRWARELGVPVMAGLRPEQKLAAVGRVEASGGALMVGDGVNDGPAMAAAGVGIVLRHSADVARTAADVLLLRDDLRVVPWLVSVARQSRLVLSQNLAWACAYNLVGVGLAAAGLLEPALAALAMVTSSATVTANALTLRKFPVPFGIVGEGDP